MVTTGTASDVELYNSLHEGRHRFKQWPIWLWRLKRRPAGGQLGLLGDSGTFLQKVTVEDANRINDLCAPKLIRS
jgi:hypothetical protein